MRAFAKWGFRDSGPRSGLGGACKIGSALGYSCLSRRRLPIGFWPLWVRLKSIASTEAPAISARMDSAEGIDWTSPFSTAGDDIREPGPCRSACNAPTLTVRPPSVSWRAMRPVSVAAPSVAGSSPAPATGTRTAQARPALHILIRPRPCPRSRGWPRARPSRSDTRSSGNSAAAVWGSFTWLRISGSTGRWP